MHHVVASDKIANIDKTICRLQLHLTEPSIPENSATPAATKEVSLELSKEELDQLIEQLEAAKEASDQLKAAATVTAPGSSS